MPFTKRQTDKHAVTERKIQQQKRKNIYGMMLNFCECGGLADVESVWIIILLTTIQKICTEFLIRWVRIPD